MVSRSLVDELIDAIGEYSERLSLPQDRTSELIDYIEELYETGELPYAAEDIREEIKKLI